MNISKIHTNDAPEAIGPYSQAVRVGDFVFTSGQIALVPESGSVEATDIAGQTEQVMKTLQQCLRRQAAALKRPLRPPAF